jgi:chromate transporter
LFFGVFLKIGAILYGSGYVLFAFLDAELVAGLLSRATLIDAIAGAVYARTCFSSVTFMGYQLNGVLGALVSCWNIFASFYLLPY